MRDSRTFGFGMLGMACGRLSMGDVLTIEWVLFMLFCLSLILEDTRGTKND